MTYSLMFFQGEEAYHLQNGPLEKEDLSMKNDFQEMILNFHQNKMIIDLTDLFGFEEGVQ